MANMVQITAVDQMGADAIQVQGTVDGIIVAITVWKSHLDTYGTVAAKKTYARQQLKAAYLASVPQSQTALIDAAPVST